MLAAAAVVVKQRQQEQVVLEEQVAVVQERLALHILLPLQEPLIQAAVVAVEKMLIKRQQQAAPVS
jgi:hypothetical protein